MTRNLKILGLALVAVFAFSAMTAAGASAQVKTGLFTLSGEGPWTLDVTETGEALDNSFTAFGGVTDCTHNTYSAESEAASVVSQTVTVEYTNCSTTPEGGGTLSTTVNMNGCDYTFSAEKALDETDHTWTATASLDCPTAEGPIISLYSSGSHALRVCKIVVSPGNHLPEHNLHFTNITPDPKVAKKDLGLKGTVTLHAVKSGLCGAGTSNTAIYHADVTIELTDKNGVKQDLTISTQP